MKQITFSRDWDYRRDPMTTVRYRGDREYTVANDVETAARKAGVLKKGKKRGSDNGASTGGTDQPEA